ncbi:hypothetical protein K501DRAFT_331118 [Backusella circina FSU 941]|nr:hypothetical protein K501DRAFT_331118 [Backusella circina FSU 941]
MFKVSLISVITLVASSVFGATLQGSASITPQDYIGLPAASLANNPPACDIPYSSLNLARITAVENMDTSSTCNLCLKVVNSNNPSKFVYVLAVDLGGSGLDMSIPSFKELFGQQYDASPASWTTVDSSYCAGIYTPGKVNPNQGIDAGSSSVTTTTKKATTTTTKKATTTTKKATTTTKKTTTKKTTTKKTTTKKTSTKKSSSSHKPKTSTKKSSHHQWGYRKWQNPARRVHPRMI